MKLSVALILYELSRQPDPPVIESRNLLQEHAPVSGVRLYDGGIADAAVVYLAEPEDLSAGDMLPVHLLVAGLPGGGLAAGAAYVGLTLRELVNRVGRIFDSYNQIEAELNAAVARSEPLKTILSICARCFDNPITLSDLRMRFIETSDNVEYDLMPEYFKVVLDTGYIDMRLMHAVKKRGIDKLINTCSDTLLLELDEIPARYFSKNIYEDGHITACLVIHEVFRRLERAQTVIVEQITQLIDDYAFRSPRGKQTSMTHLEQLISGLLDGGTFDRDMHAGYLRQMNWGERAGYYLVKLQVHPHNYATNTAQYTFDSARGFFPGSLIIERDDSATIVICASQIQYNLDTALTHLEKYLAERHDRAAVSRRFDCFGDIPDHNKAISMALKLGEAMDPDRPIYHFGDYSLPTMLMLCSRELDLRVFCMREALILYDFDRQNGSEFFRSLYTYLRHNKSLAAAADALKIHRNTLLYRLGRASEISGLDISSSLTLLPMLLSYEVLYFRLKIDNQTVE